MARASVGKFSPPLTCAGAGGTLPEKALNDGGALLAGTGAAAMPACNLAEPALDPVTVPAQEGATDAAGAAAAGAVAAGAVAAGAGAARKQDGGGGPASMRGRCGDAGKAPMAEDGAGEEPRLPLGMPYLRSSSRRSSAQRPCISRLAATMRSAHREAQKEAVF